MVDAKAIKNSLTEDQIKKILNSFGASVFSETENEIIFPSLCHHIDFKNHKAKLYYYKQTKSFYCYSCSSSFDIFSLVQQYKSLQEINWNFPQSVKYVCEICGIEFNSNVKVNTNINIYNWENDIGKYLRTKGNRSLEIYDRKLLNVLSDKYYQGWIDENITLDTMEKFGIKFYDRLQQIVITIYDENNNLVGTHCRNLNPQLIDKGMKYDHLRLLNGKELKFSMGSVLYGLNVNKGNIEYTKTVYIFESPKSVLQCENILELNNSIGIFGLNMQKSKIEMLLDLGVENFIICLDKQYHSMLDENGQETKEFKKYKKIVYKIADKLLPYGKVEVIYDDIDLLEYKDSPSDKGKDIFYKLKREIIE